MGCVLGLSGVGGSPCYLGGCASQCDLCWDHVSCRKSRTSQGFCLAQKGTSHPVPLASGIKTCDIRGGASSSASPSKVPAATTAKSLLDAGGLGCTGLIHRLTHSREGKEERAEEDQPTKGKRQGFMNWQHTSKCCSPGQADAAGWGYSPTLETDTHGPLASQVTLGTL